MARKNIAKKRTRGWGRGRYPRPIPQELKENQNIQKEYKRTPMMPLPQQQEPDWEENVREESPVEPEMRMMPEIPEMEEFDIWLNENKNNISSKKLDKISKKISLRKLLHFKFKRDYKNCFVIFKQNFKSVLIIKMLIIIFTPLYILKKISWFHN